MSESAYLPSSTIQSLSSDGVDPVLLLGAGASVRSGIPLAGPLVERIAMWGYCKSHNREIDDPTLMRSDWWPWLSNQSWFQSDRPIEEHYPIAVERILIPQVTRKEFFRFITQPGVPPSRGYFALARLLGRKVIRTVLTTNFDHLVTHAANSIPEVHHLVEVRTESDYKLISTNPQYPQVVYIHGSVEHYTDRNIESETEAMDGALVEYLCPLLRDHPLIVIGYRGAEKSVMQHLLIEQRTRCHNYPHGIYWCQTRHAAPREVSRYLHQLREHIGSNLQFVEIDGFDELMESLDQAVPGLARIGAKEVASVVSASHKVFDLKSSHVSFSKLGESLLRSKLLAYADATRVKLLGLGSSNELAAAAAERSLAQHECGEWFATNGGLILFGGTKDCQLKQSSVMITLDGPLDWIKDILDSESKAVRVAESDPGRVVLSGDLWTQLDKGLDLLARVNKMFRLKGTTSRDVHPYAPLALRELFTNMLAHRSYDTSDVAQIAISPMEIRFVNPGGLVEHVRMQLGARDIQRAVDDQGTGIKGYRNPVVADFFYAAGAMDKKGSGLPDVLLEAHNNLNVVEFGPTADNAQFVAVIKCRPEAISLDAHSKTAKSALAEFRYSPNTLSVLSWPQRVCKIGTLSDPKNFGVLESTASPPFLVSGEWIWSFADLTEIGSTPLAEHVFEDEVHEVPIEELFQVKGARGSIPRLLNMAFATYVGILGLVPRQEGGRIRAYFPSLDGEARKVTYQGRFKEATRTVAKPIVSRTTGRVIYWEHKAVSLRFEYFAPTWCLTITPCYIFTSDGDMGSLESERIGPLATRRAARDYNKTVLNDLYFWARILSNNEGNSFSIPLSRKASVVGLNDNVPKIEIESEIGTVTFNEPQDIAIEAIVEGETEMSEDEQLEIQKMMEEIIDESSEATSENGPKI